MPSYIVKPGDCLSKIASEHGFADFKIIYDHPNNAAFKKRRPNPHVIQPGDEMFIPPPMPKTLSLATGVQHKIIVKRPAARLQIHVRDADGEPLNARRYSLRIDGGAVIEGTSGADGLVQEAVPPAAIAGILDFPEDGVSFSLSLGNLDPLNEETGVRARLRNLGIHCPEPQDGGDGAEITRYALARLQGENGLEVTGTLDGSTTDLLRKAHDHDVIS